MKKTCFLFGILLACPFLTNCGGVEGTAATSAATQASTATNATAPAVDVPGGTAISTSESLPPSGGSKSVSGVVSKQVGDEISPSISIDDTNFAIGRTDFAWVLNVTETQAKFIAEMAKGLFFAQDDGDASALSIIIKQADGEGIKTDGPDEVVGPSEVGGKLTGAVNFASFTGCSTDGTFHLPKSGNPLSMTLFMGKSSTSLKRAVVLCVTSLDPLKGKVWMDSAQWFGLFTDGRTSPTTFRVFTDIDMSNTDSSCPFTKCRKFTTKMFTSGGGSTQFSGAPNKWHGILYLNDSNTKQFLLSNAGTFAAVQSYDPCIRMDGFVINVASNGTEAAGKIDLQRSGATISRANSGVLTASCVASAAAIESSSAANATGICANSSGTVLTSGQCSVDNSFTLLADVSASTVEADTQFPSDAPTTFP